LQQRTIIWTNESMLQFSLFIFLLLGLRTDTVAGKTGLPSHRIKGGLEVWY
jgi:hypothetical protein